MSAQDDLRGLRGQLVIEASPEAVAQRLADDLIHILHQRIREAGTAHLALSGGASPQGLYQLLATDARYPRTTGRTPTCGWSTSAACLTTIQD